MPRDLNTTSDEPSWRALLAPYLERYQTDLLSQVVTSVPLLSRLTQYYILQPSKRLRPAVILLMCQATNGLGSEWHTKSGIVCGSKAYPAEECRPESLSILPSQYLLAQIVELVHVASLLHDDVIDNAQTRRSVPSAPALFGPNRSILGGDYLLGRTMMLASELGSAEVAAILGQIVCTLVEGEILQGADETTTTATAPQAEVKLCQKTRCKMRGPLPSSEGSDTVLSALWEGYLLKTHMKTASLFAQALLCGVILGGATAALDDSLIREVARVYGERLGMAFQLIDDLLDYRGDHSTLGKPTNADLKAGLATAPVLFALQEDDSIRPLFLRRFAEPGDVDKVLESVRRTGALARTSDLAEVYAREANEVLSALPDTKASTALRDLTTAILVRKF